MKISSPAAALPATTVAQKPLYLAGLTPKQLACLLLAPPAHLSVDCREQLVPHPQGVCRFVAQLLVIRSRGTCIQLCQVHPVLHRCLHLLALGPVFHLEAIQNRQ
ncbi:hypothetical protein [Hymenobacter siberiensis]|uniref:hypothetical protein n=1 Tax=Hymenobacter siberiensis TaxID=2848396 RepID=UPI001C1E2620|nr:hypothetical protein [Hymenobacter siberiensis]